MIFGTLKLVYRLFVVGVVAYFVFGVPLGERTLYEHFRRIASTEEAKDLGSEIKQAGAKVGERIEDEVQIEP